MEESKFCKCIDTFVCEIGEMIVERDRKITQKEFIRLTYVRKLLEKFEKLVEADEEFERIKDILESVREES